MDSKTTYYKVIMEEEGMVRRELLRTKAKENLTVLMTEMIDGGRWDQFFNAAEELIKREAKSPSDEVVNAGAAQLQVNTLKQ